MSLKKGYFITFEGIDGSGKTSILKRVLNELKNNNVDIESTREPGGNIIICERIRKLVLDEFKEMNKYTEALLFAASRSQHVNEYIVPKINKGTNIICDRFLDSSIAYQGFGREIGYENIEKINRFAIKDFNPDFTFFFKVDKDIALKRIFINVNREKNRFDFEKEEFQNKIILGYEEIIKNNPKRIILIDANKSFDEVYDQVWNKLKEIFRI